MAGLTTVFGDNGEQKKKREAGRKKFLPFIL